MQTLTINVDESYLDKFIGFLQKFPKEKVELVAADYTAPFKPDIEYSQKDFQSWAEKNVILLELDFPRRTKLPQEIQEQNAALQNAFQVRGYPTVWLFHLDKDESNGQFQIEGLGKTGYRATVKEFTTDIDSMIAQYKGTK